MESHHPSPTDAVTTVSERGPISETVIDAVAEANGVDPVELTPLYETIDGDILDSLVSSSGEYSLAPLTVEFTWEGCRVSTCADGEVVVVPLDEANAAQSGATTD